MLKYTQTMPTAEGWYFVRDTRCRDDALPFMWELRANDCGLMTWDDVDDPAPTNEDTHDEYMYYAGPIPEPE